MRGIEIELPGDGELVDLESARAGTHELDEVGIEQLAEARNGGRGGHVPARVGARRGLERALAPAHPVLGLPERVHPPEAVQFLLVGRAAGVEHLVVDECEQVAASRRDALDDTAVGVPAAEPFVGDVLRIVALDPALVPAE